MAGLPEPREAPTMPRTRSGVRGGGASLQVGRGGRGGGVLNEVWRNYQLAAAPSGKQCSSVGEKHISIVV